MSLPSPYFTYEDQILKAGKVSLIEIARTVGTPAYVYSAQGFLDPITQLRKYLGKMDHLICFAMKANSNLSVLKLLNQVGVGMDLVSGGELHRASLLKTPADHLVFSGVGKTTREMSDALDYQGQGIYSFNIESMAELTTLNQVALEKGKKARVALRFNPDVDAKSHPYISTGLKKNKFGMNRNEILKIAASIRELQAIEFAGVSIHIGSQILTLAPIEQAFRKLRILINELNDILPKPLTFADLGGGLGVRYQNEKPPRLETYCNLIKKHFGIPKSSNQPPLKILIEPGRMISANAGILLTRVLFRKKRKDKDFLILDAGMNDLIRPALYQSYHHIAPLEKSLAQGKQKKTNVVGPVCESSDCFASSRPLPEKLKEGDLLAIFSSGAYGFTMANTYNSRPRPPEVLVEGEQYRVIRKRETYDDLTRGEAELIKQS